MQALETRIFTQKATCPACKGAGWFHLDVAYDHPDFGKRFACNCQTGEITARRRRRALQLADLTPAMAAQTFTTFEQHRQPAAYAAALAFATGGRDVPPWLLLGGVPGTGKTHLLAAIAHHRIAAGTPTMFKVVPKMLDWLRAGFDTLRNDQESDFQGRFDELCTIPVLLLDDLGAEHNTTWVQEKLYTLLNHRYNHELPTVISTNRSIDDIEDRIRSRMLDAGMCEWVTMQPVDLRMDEVVRKTHRRQRQAR